MFVDFTCDETKCTEIKVDTNGSKKPNQPGKDLFKFDITPDGIIPQGEQESCIGYDCGNYTLTYHKLFEGLTPNCVAYEEGKCKTCDDGYHLEDNKTCSEIDMPTCAKFDGEVCEKCVSSYYINNENECINLPSNCTEANKNGECTSCENNYVVAINKRCHEGKVLPNGTNVVKIETSRGIFYVNDFIDQLPYVDPWDGEGYPPLGTDYYYSYGTKLVYYNGAVDYCVNNKQMRLPTVAELQAIYAVASGYNGVLPTGGYFWTSSPYNDGVGRNAYSFNFSNGSSSPGYYKYNRLGVICVTN